MFLCGSRELVQAVWCEQEGEQGGDVAEQEGADYYQVQINESTNKQIQPQIKLTYN